MGVVRLYVRLDVEGVVHFKDRQIDRFNDSFRKPQVAALIVASAASGRGTGDGYAPRSLEMVWIVVCVRPHFCFWRVMMPLECMTPNSIVVQIGSSGPIGSGNETWW